MIKYFKVKRVLILLGIFSVCISCGLVFWQILQPLQIQPIYDYEEVVSPKNLKTLTQNTTILPHGFENVLRTTLHGKHIDSNGYEQSQEGLWHKPCEMYASELAIVRHEAVEPNTLSSTQENNTDICLISQLSESRIASLHRLAEYWPGAMSAAIYVSKEKSVTVKSEIMQWLNSTHRQNIAIHFVYKSGNLYPTNFLRNVAQDNCQCEYIFLLDVDFVPKKALYQEMLDRIQQGFFRTTEKKALVIPAFEIMTSDSERTVPQHKDLLLRMAKAKTIQIFHVVSFKEAHVPTNYVKWITASQPYQIEHQHYYEPYVLLKRKHSPKYDELFLQRYYNKQVHIEELNDLGFTFWVDPHGFVIHLPHSYDMEIADKIQRCTKIVYEFKKTLREIMKNCTTTDMNQEHLQLLKDELKDYDGKNSSISHRLRNLFERHSSCDDQ